VTSFTVDLHFIHIIATNNRHLRKIYIMIRNPFKLY